jgi:hypothetical protein
MIVTGLSAGIGWLLFIAGAADASRVVSEGRRGRNFRRRAGRSPGSLGPSD